MAGGEGCWGGLQKLHNEELHGFYSPPKTVKLGVIRLTESERMRWAGHVVCMGRERMVTGFCC